jgi:hypothetical protein
MKSVIRQAVGGKIFNFYRATPGNEVVYIVIFGDKDQKKSLKIERNSIGAWQFAEELHYSINPLSSEILRVVAENESLK